MFIYWSTNWFRSVVQRAMNPTTKIADARKSYRISLRHKLSKSYDHEFLKQAPIDRRWINGFMAAGYHSGLITLTELKIECLSA
jgi:hypothetical protein